MHANNVQPYSQSQFPSNLSDGGNILPNAVNQLKFFLFPSIFGVLSTNFGDFSLVGYIYDAERIICPIFEQNGVLVVLN